MQDKTQKHKTVHLITWPTQLKSTLALISQTIRRTDRDVLNGTDQPQRHTHLVMKSDVLPCGTKYEWCTLQPRPSKELKSQAILSNTSFKPHHFHRLAPELYCTVHTVCQHTCSVWEFFNTLQVYIVCCLFAYGNGLCNQAPLGTRALWTPILM